LKRNIKKLIKLVMVLIICAAANASWSPQEVAMAEVIVSVENCNDHQINKKTLFLRGKISDFPALQYCREGIYLVNLNQAGQHVAFFSNRLNNEITDKRELVQLIDEQSRAVESIHRCYSPNRKKIARNLDRISQNKDHADAVHWAKSLGVKDFVQLLTFVDSKSRSLSYFNSESGYHGAGNTVGELIMYIAAATGRTKILAERSLPETRSRHQKAFLWAGWQMCNGL
jgi:hypothetical protein